MSRDSGLSIDTLQRTFYTYLDESPDVKILKRERVHLRIDATYFKRFCALCYQDHEDGYTQLVRFSDGEHFEEIREDLTNLIRLGVRIESITTDGHKSILKAIKKSLPDAIVQRCLVHIQRMCLLWLTRLSQTFSRDRATSIGASNHGDQNRERPSLLDKAIQHVA
ncbi:MAG: transposase [Cytophagales bacterium]